MDENTITNNTDELVLNKLEALTDSLDNTIEILRPINDALVSLANSIDDNFAMVQRRLDPIASEYEYKKCSCCTEEKSLNNFHVVQRYKNGNVSHKAFCKECDAKYRFVNRCYEANIVPSKDLYGVLCANSDEEKLLEALLYFDRCKTLGGKTDYKWWHVDEMLDKYINIDNSFEQPKPKSKYIYGPELVDAIFYGSSNNK